MMKTPLTFYGGKQRLAGTILQLIPEHQTYTESFIGGGALFWAKKPSVVEIVNDNNRELINFYEVVQNEFVEFEKYIRISLYSRSLYNDAVVIYNNPHMFDRLRRAWAVWLLANQSFGGKLDGGWGIDKVTSTSAGRMINKRNSFSYEYALRLQSVQVECSDALKIITSRDHPLAFHYCDPPYYNSNCGHYNGYSISDFESLLQVLEVVKGKFLLSSYSSDLLQAYTRKNRWSVKMVDKNVTIHQGIGKAGKRKLELLTANYDIHANM